MMITTIGLYIYVLLSSNECSYYDDNDNWFIYMYCCRRMSVLPMMITTIFLFGNLYVI